VLFFCLALLAVDGQGLGKLGRNRIRRDLGFLLLAQGFPPPSHAIKIDGHTK